MQWGVQKLGIRLRTAVLITVLLCSLFPLNVVHAEQLDRRSLAVSDTQAGATAKHTFGFVHVTGGVPIGSVEFLYCDSPLEDLPCVAPPGVDASGATLAGQTGETGYSIVGTTPNSIVLSRPPEVTDTITRSTYAFTGVVNPSDERKSYFVRIHTYTNAGDSSYIDFGSVVNTTGTKIMIETEVPPLLKFCVGVNIRGDCETADGNLVDLGILDTHYAGVGTSQMQVATNAEFGVAIAVYGTTMTSGNQTLPPLANPTASAPGNSQFGMNLRQNSSPQVGENPRGSGVVFPTVRYNTPDRFTYRSGDVVAVGIVPTLPQTLTVSYLANISGTQMPGIYTATMTFVCTGVF